MNHHFIESTEKEVKGEIMATDIFIKVFSEKYSHEEMTRDIEYALDMFRIFGKKFSRFERENELWNLNHSDHSKISPEMFDILNIIKEYYHLTEGIFNPSILPILKKEGYVLGKQNHFLGVHEDDSKVYPLNFLRLDAKNLEVEKPSDMHLDFGGVGKGYIIDRVAAYLQSKYENFLVDAGGDMMAKGMDTLNKYPYWAIDVEHPYDVDKSVHTLLLKDVSVATSGSNRRKWRTKHNEEKHHIIDPFLMGSAQSDLVSVTVVSDTAVDADIWAKVFFIAGFKKGFEWAERMKKPALFFKSDGSSHFNAYLDPYVWK